MAADLLIADATVVDGDGGPPFPGHVAVEGGRIVRVARSGEAEPEAARRVAARGRVVCPGFVDVHSHADASPFFDPSMDSALRQGVTTVIVGNCGISAPPRGRAADLVDELPLTGRTVPDPGIGWGSLAGYLAAVDEARPAVNVAALIGHGTVRRAVLGMERRVPDAEELRAMARLVREGMEAGALGLSTGLVYAPGMYAGTDEIAALAREAAALGGVYASHVRGEGQRVFAAVEEAVEVGRRTGAPVQVSHLKLEGGRVWGRAGELLDTLARAREEGVDVRGDQYPYDAYHTDLASFLPPWAPVGGLGGILADASRRRRLVSSVESGEDAWQSSVDGVGWDRIVVVGHRDPTRWGRSVAELAHAEDAAPIDAFFGLLLADPSTAVIGHAMRERDLRTILSDPEVMVGSDSTAISPGGPFGAAPTHPRTYGTFPRVLGRYVRDLRCVPLAQAVRRMTALPADRFGLAGRGRLTAGAIADIVLFDPATVADRATFEEPHAFAQGVELVVVGGRVAWSEAGDGERAGRALRRGP